MRDYINMRTIDKILKRPSKSHEGPSWYYTAPPLAARGADKHTYLNKVHT
jgi:hypothetical protein